MKRKLFTLASALSLLLCLATAALWVRSKRSADVLYFGTSGGNLWFVHSTGGIVRISYLNRWPSSEPMHWLVFRLPPGMAGDLGYPLGSAIGTYYQTPRRSRHFMGITAERGAARFGGSYYDLVAPLNVPIVGLAIAPSLWALNRSTHAVLRWRRRRRCRCPSCGYDLRATPDCCPECGAPVGIKSEVAT